MHPCAVLLGEVLTLARFEEEALQAENLEQAEDLAQKRLELMEQAWKEREGYDVDILRNTLLVIQAMQERLMEMATGVHTRLTMQMKHTQQQGKYFSGDRYQVAESKKSYFLSKMS